MNNKIIQTSKILIVEDEAIVAMDIEQHLKKIGYDVVGVVDNGSDAILKVEEVRPDLILMDIRIKGSMDGTETTNVIHQRFNIPVIFLTAYSDEVTLERAKQAEPMGFLLKPVKKNELQTMIMMVLYKHAAIVSEQQEQLRKNLEKELKYRDEFISIAAHELKTPLTTFNMQIQLLNRFLSEIKDPRIQKYLEMMQNSKEQLDRLATLVDDLLDVTRAREGRLTIERTESNLSEIIRRVAKNYETELIKSKCTLELHLGPPIIGMWDSVRIEQVVLNLLSNAAKYGDGKPIEISAKVEGPNAVLIVHDNGIGIAKVDQARIFNRFERVSSIKSFAGLGLGLFITRQIVTVHTGSIRFESELGKGSTFIVELPLQSPPTVEKNSDITLHTCDNVAVT